VTKEGSYSVPDFANLLNGFFTALSPVNLLWCFIGSVLGTLVGVLPGIGPTSAIAILLPLTAFLSPIPAIIMLAGVYYGSQYGGSTTSILVNMPGEISSVVTCLDGYALTKKGRAGPALAIAAISSFIAGTVSLVGLSFFAPLLATLALEAFGPPEYFALLCLALTIAVSLSERSLARGLASMFAGLLIGAIGIDPISGGFRYTFGQTALLRGVEFISACIGLFAVAEVAISLEEEIKAVYAERLKGLWPSKEDFRRCWGAFLRSTVIGFFLGLIPGITTGIAAFLAYDVEKRVSKHPEEFGRGAIEGVAAPEGANNSATSGAFVPLMALGIPSSPSMAILLGALMIYGLQPGPLLFELNSEFVWAVIASMYIGNVMLLILNLPLVGMWAKVATIRYGLLAPLILIFSFIGAFSVRNSFFDVGTAIIFGFIGYLMKKGRFPAAPMILALVLGPKIEPALYQALALSNGSLSIFYLRPVALVSLILAVFSLFLSFWIKYRHPEVPIGEDED
jgi:putative tricarboxylic transport membrane protein